VLDENDGVVFEFTSKDEPVQLENLAINTVYTLHEEKAPHGYNLAEDFDFSIDADGNIKLADGTTVDTGILSCSDEMFLVTASVKKVWKDEDNRDTRRPMSINVKLMQKNADGTTKAVVLNGSTITKELSIANGWSAQVTGLPMVDENLKDIEYFWAEAGEIAGYTVTSETVEFTDDNKPAGVEKKTIGFATTLTNTYPPEKIDINVKKIWADEDNAYQTRPEDIKVQLYANGIACGETLTLSAANNWTASWTGLYKYENTNPNALMGTAKAINYTVEELNVPAGYQATITGNGTTGFVITNVLERGKLIIEKTFDFEPIEPEEPDNTPFDIPVIKTWNDNGNKDGNRPESVKVHLLADGVEVASAELNEANEWKYTFTEMPRLNGEEQIVYTITEDPVKWYEAQINGYNVLNVYKPELTEATVSKVWNDGENELGLRPSTIYMRLSNGTVVLLSESNGWTATVRDLPAYVNGEAVTYTWTEQEAPGYEQVSRTINGNTTVFVNRLMVVPEIPTEQVQPTVPGGGWVIFEEYDTALGGETLINHVGDCFD
jgi:hypothetical protein